MELEMQVAQEKVRFVLYDAYEAVGMLEGYIQNEMQSPSDLLAETRSYVKRMPELFSCYVAFPPYYSPQGNDKWYCPASYRAKDSIRSVMFGDARHDYFTREWYDGALQSGKTGYWSQPYLDEDFDEPIFTYSDDVRDKDGNVVCIIGLDFSVRRLQQLLDRFRPFDEAVLQLYSSNGTLLTSGGTQRNEKNRVVVRRTLQPVNIDMVMAVPRSYIWASIRLGIWLPLAVFVLGIVAVWWMFRRLMREEQENARLGTEKEVMAHELRIAHDIQMGILKGEMGTVKSEREDVEIQATLLPMKAVGGDLYDYRQDGDYLWFIIGDVSGKGVSAALFMSATVNLFRAIGAHAHSPKQIMEEMNAVLSENNPSLTFVTAFIGRLHVPSGELLYCNAGHCAPLVKGEREKVKSERFLDCEPNIPLGYKGDYAFVEQGCMVDEGESLVLYTDGVTEARNKAGQMMGKKRWAEIVSGHEELIEQVKAYIGTAEPTDDITLMTIRKRTPVQAVTLCVPNHEDQWQVLRRVIHEYGICAGIEKHTLRKLEVAAEEAVVNIIRHSGASKIEMAISYQPSAISLQLRDDGAAFNPTAYETKAGAVEERQVGGMGISLIRQIADEMRYERMEEKNVLTLVKLLNC